MACAIFEFLGDVPMMDMFRNLGQSWVAKIFMILIALSFVMWGVSGYLVSGNSGSSTVATVNGQRISDAAFQKRLEETQARYNHVFGAAAAAKMAKENGFARDVLDGMIDNLLLATEASRLGLVVPEIALAKKVESIPSFQNKGVFSKSRYEKLLTANNMTPAQFEAMLRESMRLEQLQVIPQVMAMASDAEATRIWAWSQEYRDVSAAKLPATDFAAAAQPTEAEVVDYYHAHADQFQSPAQVQVRYVVLGPDHFVSKPPSPANAAASTSSATAAGRSAVSGHDRAEMAFQAQIENFKDRLFSNPDSLGAVARAYDLKIEDSGVLTAGKVPSQGPFTDPKALAAAFSKAVLAGKNSNAVTLANGDLLAVHLLHYTPGSAQPLRAVEGSITARLTATKAEQLAKSKAQALLVAARRDHNVDVLTDHGTYPVRQYLDVTRHNGQGLDAAMLKAVFAAPAPAAGAPTMGMVKSADGYQVFAVTRVSAPSVAALNPKVGAQIRATLEEQRGRLLSAAYLKDLRRHAKVKINATQLARFSHAS